MKNLINQYLSSTEDTMTDTLRHEMAIFANRHNLSSSEAVTLPALFEKAAESTGLPIRSLVSQATYTNQKLADYLVSIAKEVA